MAYHGVKQGAAKLICNIIALEGCDQCLEPPPFGRPCEKCFRQLRAGTAKSQSAGNQKRTNILVWPA